MKQLVNELYDYELTGEVKIKESEDDEKILTMVIDEDQDNVAKKAEEKMGKMFLNHQFHENELEMIVL